MKTNIKNIQNEYNNNDYEINRLKVSPIHNLEYILTVDILNKYIKNNKTVLDLGAGPGIYSKYLLENKECKVGLIDLSEKLLNHFNENINKKYKNKVLFTKIDSALSKKWIETEKYDYILLFGPLYHLKYKNERNKVLLNVYKSLKNDGLLFSAYISPYKNLALILNNNAKNIKNNKYLSNLSKGLTFYKNMEQFRCFPCEAKNELINNNFKIIDTISLEGIGSLLSDNEKSIIKKNNTIKNKWIKLVKENCRNNDIIGATLHYLIVSKK